jgi:4-hydroxybenzoate polyprenyltransferase
MVDRDDDLRIGMKTSAITLGRWDVAAVSSFYVFFMLFWALSLSHVENFALYLCATGLGLAQAVWHHRLIRHRERDACFRAFRTNHWLGFTLFAGLALALALP